MVETTIKKGDITVTYNTSEVESTYEYGVVADRWSINIKADQGSVGEVEFISPDSKLFTRESTWTTARGEAKLSNFDGFDYEIPTDENSDNTYEVEFTVESGGSKIPFDISIEITDKLDTELLLFGGDHGYKNVLDTKSREQENQTITGKLKSTLRGGGDRFKKTYGIEDGTNKEEGIATKSGDYGELTLNTSTGEYTYTTNSPETIDAIGGFQIEYDSFTITLDDNEKYHESQTSNLTFQLWGANDSASEALLKPSTISEDITPNGAIFIGSISTDDPDGFEFLTLTVADPNQEYDNGLFTLQHNYDYDHDTQELTYVGPSREEIIANDKTVKYYDLYYSGKERLDYEEKNEFTILIIDTSSDFIQELPIKVTNANDKPRDIGLSSHLINATAGPGDAVTKLTTVDDDEGDTHTYSMTSGTGDDDNKAFSIDGDQLKINSLPDYETKSSYSIRVRTTDTGGLTFDKVLALTVNDLDETVNDAVIVIPPSINSNSGQSNESNRSESQEENAIPNTSSSSSTTIPNTESQVQSTSTSPVNNTVTPVNVPPLIIPDTSASDDADTPSATPIPAINPIDLISSGVSLSTIEPDNPFFEGRNGGQLILYSDALLEAYENSASTIPDGIERPNFPIEAPNLLDETPINIDVTFTTSRTPLDLEQESISGGGGRISSNAPSSFTVPIDGVYANLSAGNDRIRSSIFNDFLRAGAGDDIIDGGDGDDLIRGGAGSDLITLGAGQDIVYFTADQLDGSRDIITDFTGEDSIQLGENIRVSQVEQQGDNLLVTVFTEIKGVTRSSEIQITATLDEFLDGLNGESSNEILLQDAIFV